MIKNMDYIIYTYKHRKVVDFLARKYLSKEEYKEISPRLKLHDFDKELAYLFYPKKVCSKIHRENISHHVENELDKERLDYLEMIFDWESARYTKPDKPLNAYDTMLNYYVETKDKVLPLLKELGLDKENAPFEKDVEEYANSLNDISINEIEEELISNIKYIFKNK